MPHISGRKLSEEVHSKLHFQLFNLLLSSPRNKRKEIEAVEQLFTDTEKVMLAKRLAAILLLSRGLSQYQVWKVLGLSPSTTGRISNAVEGRVYVELVRLVERRRSQTQLKKDMSLLLDLCMPDKGKRRWDWLDDLYA